MSINFKGIAADFVADAKKFKADLLTVAADAPKVIGKIEADAPEIEAVTNLVYPGAAAVEQAGLVVLETIATAVEAAGSAATANGLTVSLDQATLSAVQGVLPTLKALAAKV
jgi:hypothetical protein